MSSYRLTGGGGYSRKHKGEQSFSLTNISSQVADPKADGKAMGRSVYVLSLDIVATFRSCVKPVVNNAFCLHFVVF
jgi:hypothetical protein